MRKLLKIIGGFLLLAIGLLLSIPGIPGPGLAIAFVGLLMLSDHFHWARRLTHWARCKFEAAKARIRRRSPVQE